MVYANPPRENYPPELLTHRFMPYGSLVKTSTDKDTDGDENDTAVASRLDRDVAMTEVDSNIQSDVVEKEERNKAKGITGKKKKDRKAEEVEEMEVDEEIQKEKKEKKRSGKKRKGEEDVPPKKSKKAKTTSV